MYKLYFYVQNHKEYFAHNICENFIPQYVIVKPHHKEDIFVITRGRGVNNKDSYPMSAGGV